MLNDMRRVSAYRDAIRISAKDKVIADVGAGTGILSIMAAEAGASKIYAIEFSAIVKECKRRVNKSNHSARIKVMNIRAEEAPLNEGELDLIISEWMGYFLIFERMLPSVLSVRDKYLKAGG